MKENQLTALLIEDNPGDARLVRESLMDASAIRMTIIHRTSLADALQELKNGAFDLVLLDLGLPDVNGLEAVARLNHELPSLPILVMSGNEDEELALQAIQSGAQDYLVKGTFDGSTLMRGMRYVLSRKRTLSQQAELISTLAEELRRPLESLRSAVDELSRVAAAMARSAADEPLTRAKSYSDYLQSLQTTMIGLVRAGGGSLTADLHRLSAAQLINEIVRRARSESSETIVEAPDRRLPVQLLLVEDNPGDVRLVQETLADARDIEATIVHCISVSEAMARLQNQRFDVAIVDLGLPDAVGLEAVSEIHYAAPAMPIVVLTGTDDETMALGALARGAQDYMVKGSTDPEALGRTLRYAIERQRASNLCTDLLEGLACELRTPVHLILGNLCLAGLSLPLLRSEPKVKLLLAAFDAASSIRLLSDAAIELARSGGVRQAETGTAAGIEELRRNAGPRVHLANSAAADWLRAVERLGAVQPETEPEASSGLLGRWMRRAKPRKRSALVYDTDHDARLLTTTFLRASGFNVTEIDVIEQVKTQLSAGDFDVAVTDISAAAGVELRTQLRAAGVPIVVVHDGRVSDGSGASRHEALLAKPFAPDQLLFAAEHLMRRA